MKKRVVMLLKSPDGRAERASVPYAVAWAAARGIAINTHYDVQLVGEFGTATFDYDGGGTVEWNEKSTCKGDLTKFAPNCTVCI